MDSPFKNPDDPRIAYEIANAERAKAEADKKTAEHIYNIVCTLAVGLPVLIIICAIAYWIVRHGMAVG